MSDRRVFKCDSNKNTNCKKTICQGLCKFTTNQEYSIDGKTYAYDNTLQDYVEVQEENQNG